jgi:hypothetical protein
LSRICRPLEPVSDNTVQRYLVSADQYLIDCGPLGVPAAVSVAHYQCTALSTTAIEQQMSGCSSFKGVHSAVNSRNGATEPMAPLSSQLHATQLVVELGRAHMLPLDQLFTLPLMGQFRSQCICRRWLVITPVPVPASGSAATSERLGHGGSRSRPAGLVSSRPCHSPALPL